MQHFAGALQARPIGTHEGREACGGRIEFAPPAVLGSDAFRCIPMHLTTKQIVKERATTHPATYRTFSDHSITKLLTQRCAGAAVEKRHERSRRNRCPIGVEHL